MMRYEYSARITDRDDVTRSPELRDLAYRRTQPFLRNGTHLSIEHLMQEAYAQGLRDAAQAVA